jgi:hypothetical protein
VIIAERPPNFDQILAAFPDAGKPGVIFAYGEHIYNPTGNPIPPALLAHEAVHCLRQRAMKCAAPLAAEQDGVGRWWEMYIADPMFRYTEELFAHVAEFKAQANGIDRNYRAKLLMSTAARLVAPLYNYVPPRSLKQAVSDLTEELRK